MRTMCSKSMEFLIRFVETVVGELGDFAKELSLLPAFREGLLSSSNDGHLGCSSSAQVGSGEGLMLSSNQIPVFQYVPNEKQTAPPPTVTIPSLCEAVEWPTKR